MEIVASSQALRARGFLARAAEVAKESKCLKAHCGAVVVLDDQVVGRGYNAPPQDRSDLATCSCRHNANSAKPRYDQTCCLHAEWRAVLDAVGTGRMPQNASLYFLRLLNDDSWAYEDSPYCTVCSRLILDVGITEICVSSRSGIVSYPAEEFYRLSYEFHSMRPEDGRNPHFARQAR
jgi:dCMP deaminase